MASDAYSVSHPTGVCAVTGKTIPVGQPCMSLLVEPKGADALARYDVALDAWLEGARPDLPGPVVGVWRTVVPEKDAPRRQLIGDDEVVDLFEQLGEADDPKQLAFRYLLCLILIRKRRLIWDSAVPARGGKPGKLLVRRPREKDADPIEVIDPGLNDEAIEDATRQLSMVMNLDDDEA